MMNRRNNELAYYDPFRELDDLGRTFFAAPFDRHGMNDFQTDIKDEGDHYTVEADLPGFEKENINVDINGDFMTITAERHSEHEDKDKKGKYIRWERSYGSYTRRFDLSDVNAEGIDGKYENGVLTINLPKKTAIAPAKRRLQLK